MQSFGGAALEPIRFLKSRIFWLPGATLTTGGPLCIAQPIQPIATPLDIVVAWERRFKNSPRRDYLLCTLCHIF